jgi:hypothetical protein
MRNTLMILRSVLAGAFLFVLAMIVTVIVGCAYFHVSRGFDWGVSRIVLWGWIPTWELLVPGVIAFVGGTGWMVLRSSIPFTLHTRR